MKTMYGLLFSVLLLTACTQSVDTVKIGFIGPLTGSSSVLGENLEMGARLALEEINGRGGINGTTLEILFEDGQCNAKTAVNALQRVLIADDVSAVIASCSPEMLGVAPILEEKGIIGFSTFATNPNIKYSGDYIFRNTPNDELQASIGAELILDDSHRRVAIFHLQHDYGVGLKDALIEELGDDAEIVAVEVHETGSADMRAQLTKIKERGPDALYLVAFPIEGSYILQQATELGLDIPIYAAEALKDPSILHDASGYQEKIIITVPNGEGPEFDAFSGKFRERFGEDPGIYAAETYDGVMLLAKAIQDSDGTSTGIKNYLYAMEPYSGASGITVFDKYGEIQKKPYDLFTVENGAFAYVGQR